MAAACECWLAKFSTSGCYGRLIRAHLIPRQTLRRHVPDADPWDPRTWVLACGGVMGNASHHGQFDAGHIIIPFLDLPVGVLEFADEHNLMWYLVKHYPVMSEDGVG